MVSGTMCFAPGFLCVLRVLCVKRFGLGSEIQRLNTEDTEDTEGTEKTEDKEGSSYLSCIV